jgi:hypothetical protein
VRRLAWLGRPSSGVPRVYHLDPDCGSRRLSELPSTTEAAARKVARLCGTCCRVYGPYEARWTHKGVPV